MFCEVIIYFFLTPISTIYIHIMKSALRSNACLSRAVGGSWRAPPCPPAGRPAAAGEGGAGRGRGGRGESCPQGPGRLTGTGSGSGSCSHCPAPAHKCQQIVCCQFSYTKQQSIFIVVFHKQQWQQQKLVLAARSSALLPTTIKIRALF